MLQVLIYFLLFILPLIVLPFGISPFETPKIIAAELGIGLWLVVALLTDAVQFKNISKPQLILSSGIILLSVIHLLFLQTETTLLGNPFRLHGIFLLWCLLIFSLVSSMQQLKLSKLAVIIPPGLLLSSLFIFGKNESHAFIGTLGEANALAATAVFFGPWLFFNGFRGKLLSIVFVVSISVLAGSRSGLLGFGISAFFLILIYIFKKPIATALIVCFLCIGISFGLPFIEENIAFENRGEVWRTAWNSGWESPLIGHGFGNTEQALEATALRMQNNLRWQYVDSSHNLLLDFWVQGGSIGVGLLLGLLFIACKGIIKQKNLRGGMLLIGLVTVQSFNPASIVTLVAFWWVIGQGSRKQVAESAQLAYTQHNDSF